MPPKICQQCATQVPAQSFIDHTTSFVVGASVAMFYIISSLQISGYTSRNPTVKSVAFYGEILETYRDKVKVAAMKDCHYWMARSKLN